MNGHHMNNYFVLTVKDYLPIDKQIFVEKEIAEYIKSVWQKYKISCVFIPTGANPIEENDIPVGIRLARLVGDQDIFSIKIPATPEVTKSILRGATFSVCTRMHSAIFSVTEYTPLIAIAYEHKSIGFLESINLQDWYITMKDATKNELMRLTNKLLNKKVYTGFVNHLKLQREKIIVQSETLKNIISEQEL
jgi:colanic acid/amylovoran biosynthesis protein